MVAETNSNSQLTNSLTEQALMNTGLAMSELNRMQGTLSQTLSENAGNLSKSQINTYEDALRQNTQTMSEAIEASTSIGNNLGGNLRAASNNLVNQMVITDILEDEVHNAERAYDDLKQNNIDKLRMVDINTYYTEKYRAQTDLMKLIIYFAIPLLLITILANKGIIGNNLAYGLGGLILVIGIIVVLWMLYDINNRDPMNFREYNVHVDIKAEEQAEAAGDIDPWDAIASDSEAALKALERQLGVGCIQKDCCDPPYTKYDKNMGKCVPGPYWDKDGGDGKRHWEQSKGKKGKTDGHFVDG